MAKNTRLLAGTILTAGGVAALLTIQAGTTGRAVPQDPASQAEPGAPSAAAALGWEQDLHAQHGAVEAMSGEQHHHAGNPHMKLTTARPLTDADKGRADSIVQTLRRALEKYKDSNAAMKDGYQPFLAHLPLPEYHFTNYRFGLVQAFTFNPERPTSLLFRKTGRGYELAGAMYTAPKRFTEDQLHARIPLSVATWHAHVNICMPARNVTKPDWSRFGLRGTIASVEECGRAGGRFFPQLFGWMVHVYPYEKTRRAPGRTAPRAKKHASRLSWLSPRTFVTVSDLRKHKHPHRCGRTDQSIHIFRL